MRSFLMNAVAGAVILAFGYGVIRMYVRGAQFVREFDMLKAQIVRIEEENSALEKDIEYYSHPENLEKEARARLNVKKPGEKLIVITPPRHVDPRGDAGNGGAPEDVRSWWEKIKSFLLGD